jgi:A/G-specific adenine glycosylase
MLQQTQVDRVIGAFDQFLTAYPAPADFAAATPAEVVAAWGRLGYLRRARNLHAAARVIAADGWPNDLEELPGVGPYTAAAIAAFADDRRVAAIDVNLRRVLSRWEGAVLSEQDARALGNDLVDGSRPGDWNQAMMDLGAVLCRPRAPRCAECPVVAWCRDPSIEIPSRSQGRFEGSIRQARAATLKLLVAGPHTLGELETASGLDPSTITAAVGALEREGAIGRHDAHLRLI